MTFFRVEHNKNYTVINNTICRDNRISWKAKGIWLYAFSRPDDWEFHLNDLLNQSTDGRDSVRSGLRELEESGYLDRSQLRNPDGTLAKAEWVFYETPKLKEKLPEPEKPSTVNPTSDNHPLLNTEYILSTENKIVCSAVAREKLSEGESIKKLNAHNQEIAITKSEIFMRAIKEHPEWKTGEIEEAINILQENSGYVNNLWKFIEGTVQKIRNRAISLAIENKKKAKKINEIQIQNQEKLECAPTLPIGMMMQMSTKLC